MTTTPASSQSDREPLVVALQGEPAPGTPPGVFFDTFEPPLMNRHGHVAFIASLTGPGVLTAGDDQGIWVDRGSGPEPLVLMGTQNPTLDPRWFFDEMFENGLLGFSDGGHVVFQAFTRGPGVDGRGYYIAKLGEPMTLLYQEIIPVDGESFIWPDGSVRWRLQGDIAINQHGEFVAAASRAEGGSELVIGGVDGPTRWLVDQSRPVAGAPAGTTALPIVSFEGPAINDNGQVVFDAFLTGPGVTQDRRGALLRAEPNGDLTLVAQEGASPPGLPDYEFDGDFVGPSINNRGDIVFGDNGVSSTPSALSIWRFEGGALEPIVVADDPADDTGIPDAVFRRVDRTPVINPNGAVAFYANVGATVNQFTPSAWIDHPGTPPRLVVIDNQPAPGLDGQGIDLAGDIGAAIADDGRMVISTRGAMSSGFLATVFIDGGVRPPEALLTGIDRIDLDPRPDSSQFRSVQQFEIQNGSSGGEDGYASYVSAAGAFAARVVVNNPSREGVFVFEPGPVCLADTNGDGLLSPADFNAWVIAFNTSNPACDQNGDGLCSPSDFNAWVINFNTGCP